jgi:hypothetical protein
MLHADMRQREGGRDVAAVGTSAAALRRYVTAVSESSGSSRCLCASLCVTVTVCDSCGSILYIAAPVQY